MSVKIKRKEASDTWGSLIIKSDTDHINGEEYIYRVNSLIRLLQTQDEEMTNHDDRYYVLEILNDMMPTPEQANKMFNSPH